jgi:Holliday junction resolvase RusA-like endonuclease
MRLPRPISVNNLYANVRGRGRVPTARYNAWKWHAAAMLAEQRPLVKHAGPVAVRLAVGEVGVAPGMDLDNCAKAVLDALKTAGVIQDDNRRIVRRIYLAWQPGLDGCECEVWPVTAEVAA